MCGIWFSLGFVPDRAHIDKVAHRGPDGPGWQRFRVSVRGPVALGHRRLSIIDLWTRRLQPMAYADGRYWLTFNGEIYNYLELRDELPRRAMLRHPIRHRGAAAGLRAMGRGGARAAASACSPSSCGTPKETAGVRRP